MSYRRAEEAAPYCGAAPMTVCTNDVALCNLVEHVLPAPALKACRDREFLVPQVVELQHDRIVLAAVDAGVFSQEGDDKKGPLFDQGFLALPGSGDVALFVGPIVLPLVLGPAGTAIGLSLPLLPAVPGEFLVWFLCLAA
ncbi:MAG TPA: hypothetical protein VFZ29_02485 [Solirubrobacterales bacterium]